MRSHIQETDAGGKEYAFTARFPSERTFGKRGVFGR